MAFTCWLGCMYVHLNSPWRMPNCLCSDTAIEILVAFLSEDAEHRPHEEQEEKKTKKLRDVRVKKRKREAGRVTSCKCWRKEKEE